MNEADVASRIEARTPGVSCRVFGGDLDYDIQVCRKGRAVAIVEVKRRNIRFTQYPTIHISARKLEKCVTLAEDSGTKFFFVAYCDDGMNVVEVTREKLNRWPRKTGGRMDRAHLKITTDIEQLVDIPVSEFKPL